jgi:hypothetical protein
MLFIQIILTILWSIFYFVLAIFLWILLPVFLMAISLSFIYYGFLSMYCSIKDSKNKKDNLLLQILVGLFTVLSGVLLLFCMFRFYLITLFSEFSLR